ncbi:MAG: dienelactone hydrolase family protein [Methanotrichaceae archaeon]|nr:dienelactone hydrolase family protein [Methanotrichaceae archaeon]
MNRFLLFLIPIALVSIVSSVSEKQTDNKFQNETINISSGGSEYSAYLAHPLQEGEWPAVVLIHSFNGLEPGYKSMVDEFASHGYVVIAPQWQTYAKSPKDDVVQQLIADSVTYLKSRKEVNSGSLGLTGFCAGGRYTMLLLPQMADFKSGVAWYGFPYSGGFNNESKPADFIKQLRTPILMIHGTKDESSPIADIYRYASDLDAAGKYFELKVYQGQPHGFAIQNGQLSDSFSAKDAFKEMIDFFNRTLK